MIHVKSDAQFHLLDVF